MTTSLRTAAERIDAPENFSVLEHVFGFLLRTPPDDPASPSSSDWERTEVSLLERMRLLDGDYHDLNVITVGWDQFTDANLRDRRERVDYAIYRAHEIYAQQDIGVGRVGHYWVDSSDADGLDTLSTDGDLEDLTEAWTVDNDGIDGFIPFQMTIPSGGGTLLGRSAVDGPCDKDGKGLDAFVVGPWNTMSLARTFSHEDGHYLGLSHPDNQSSKPMRLMTQTGTALGNGGSLRDSVDLTNGEGNECKSHCSIQND